MRQTEKNVYRALRRREDGNEPGHFNVYPRTSCPFRLVPYNRRDYFKISLIIGTGVLNYGDKVIEINQNALLFSNPNIPCSWEAISERQEGYSCLFTEEFLNGNRRAIRMSRSPAFRFGIEPILSINGSQTRYLEQIFSNMLQEMASDCACKYDVLRNYVDILIYQASNMKAAGSYSKHSNASSRISASFVELLERQFPIDSPENPLRLKTAKDYASSLSVHVNHLNRAVKETTGRTTSQHIADRIMREAEALLVHTDWNVSEIAYSLGFEYATHFDSFFKKHEGVSPKSFRR